MTTPLRLCASTAAFALSLWAEPASAETPTDPWYVSVLAGETYMSVYDPNVYGGGSQDGPGSASLSLQGGYRASRGFAVELATLGAANLSWQGPVGADVSDSRFDVEATQLSAVGIFSFGSNFEFRGKLGLADYDLTGTHTLESGFDSYWSPAFGISEPIAASGQGVLLGLGVGAHLTPQWSVWLDYQWFYIDSSFLGAWALYDESTIDTFSLAASYRFGRDRE